MALKRLEPARIFQFLKSQLSELLDSGEINDRQIGGPLLRELACFLIFGRVRSEMTVRTVQCCDQARLLIETVDEDDVDRILQFFLIIFRRIEPGFELALSSVLPRNRLAGTVRTAGRQQHQSSQTDASYVFHGRSTRLRDLRLRASRRILRWRSNRAARRGRGPIVQSAIAVSREQ